MNADFPLPPVWQHWVMDNLVHDIRHEKIIAKLVENGLSEAAARREVALVAATYARQLNAHMRLLRVLRGAAPTLPTATALDPESFWTHHWEANTPLLVRGVSNDWPARERWSFERWREELADLPVEIEVDRNPEDHYQGRFQETTLGAYLARLDTSPDAAPVNDVYCIARNHNARRDVWHRLHADLRPHPEVFDPRRLVGGTSVWLGPRGTLTPLHYDTTNIFFCQFVGKKRFHLIPPQTTELWPRMDGFYVEGDLAHVPPKATVFEVIVEPGDALFIPACWFHRVEALDASISYSFLNFRRPNAFDFYSLQRLAAEPVVELPPPI
jgi:hypothetical protein